MARSREEGGEGDALAVQNEQPTPVVPPAPVVQPPPAVPAPVVQAASPNTVEQPQAVSAELSDEEARKRDEETLRQQAEARPTPTQEELNEINERALGAYKNRAVQST